MKWFSWLLVVCFILGAFSLAWENSEAIRGVGKLLIGGFVLAVVIIGIFSFDRK